jgi:hypothetical protein
MELYYYVEHSGDTLTTQYVVGAIHPTRPIIWAQEGRYGWISKEQVQNLCRRQIDLDKQQKGYAKDGMIKLVFHWSEVQALDPVTVRLMRETSP